MTDKLVLGFADAAARVVSRSGGKGASLALMTQAGFPVPEGVVVSSECYRRFVEDWPDFEALVAALPVDSGHDPEGLREACSTLRTAMLARPFPSEIETALREGLAATAAAGTVGVRSSATLEDSAAAAFAGQHDSYLGVSGVDSIMDHVRSCWASLWEDRAVRYRHEKGFGLLDADMAVVVQTMVASEVAGVAFSMNPITGETDQVLVTAAWGLGETVVSGEGEIDQWVLQKASGSVVDAHIGAKTEEILQAPDGGTHTVEVPPDRRDVPCLNPEQLAELGRLVVAAERHYAFPQDIEWAVAEGQLWLLQSRPVTEFPARWTLQESAERFPNPITPLTWDFTTPGFHESLAHSLELMGMPPFKGEWFTRLDGYIYGNQTAVEVFAAGHQVAFAGLEGLAALVPEWREHYRWVQELPVHWARDLDYYLLELGRLGSRDLSGLSLEELWAHALDIDALGRGYFLPNIAISITQANLHRLLFQIVAHVVGPERAPEIYDGLTCFCETKTGLVNNELYELAGLIESDARLRDRIIHEDRRELYESGGLHKSPAFSERFERFLAVHGHREVDFDAYHPTWSGQPWVVLENLRLLLIGEGAEDPGVRDQEMRSRQQLTERHFLLEVPEELRTFTMEIVRLARTYTALDDLEHYQTTRLTPPFRAAGLAIGERLVERGVLEEARDVYFLRRETLAGVIDGTVPDDVATSEAIAAKADYERQLESSPPFVYGETSPAAAVEGQMTGLPGAPGVAEGAVCVVRSADDFGRFEPGSVLVARTTNPAWTPLFYSAVAVVTESGGPLSHGAVTAREFRIPAVMSVRGAMQALEDGQKVRVDGTRGLVAVVED